MEIRRTIQLPEWNEAVQQKAEEFWRARGMRIAREPDGRITGRRGSLWGNLMSPHIARVIASLSLIPVSGELECVLSVDTRYRGLTPAAKSYLVLELATFESFLLRDDMQPEAWAQHRRDASRATGDMFNASFQRALTRRGPRVLAGDLKAKAWMVFAFALLLPPAALRWGPLLRGVVGSPHNGRSFFNSFAAIMFGPVMAAAFFIVFSLMALWLLKARSDAARCLSTDQAARSLGFQPDEMSATIRALNVQPRFIVDGEPVYALDDLTGASTLLRPAHAEEAALLRPAAHAAAPATGQLLRPAEAEQPLAAHEGQLHA